MALRFSARGIQKTKEKRRAIVTAIKEDINWKKEILENGQFNGKFEKNLLENCTKNFMQGIYLGYMYFTYRKIRDLDKNDPKKIHGRCNHHSNSLRIRLRQNAI